MLGEGDYIENDTRPDIYRDGIVTIGEGTVIPDSVTIGRNTLISGHTVEADYPDGRLAGGRTLVKE